MQPLTLSLPAAFATNCCPPLLPLPLPLPLTPGRHTATTVVEITVVHCQRKRQQQQHHQLTNVSTNLKTFTSPDNLDLFNLSTVFEVYEVGQGNLAVSKLLV
jgi:hypothetical protein